MIFEKAVEDYRSGRLLSAQEKLQSIDTVAAKLLTIRIHTRLFDSVQARSAIDLASELRADQTIDVCDRLQAAALLVFLLARTGDVEAAMTIIEQLKRGLNGVEGAPTTLQSEVWQADAVARFASDRMAESERSAWNAVYADLELGYRPKPSEPPIVPIQVTKARALQLIGLIRGTQERFHEQYRFLREAMTTLRSSPTPDAYLASFLQADRSFYARDLGALGEIVELELFMLAPWPEDLVESRVEVGRSIAFLYALNGEDERAMRGFAAAANDTKSNANRLQLIADEAFVARQRSPSRVLQRELLEACAIADLVDWESIDVERYALHAFAQELSFVDPARALGFLNHFLSLNAASNPLAVSDRRAHAEAQYSVGIVSLASGKREFGLDALMNAFEIWRDIGFRWLATTAAIELAAATGSAGMIGYVRREAAQYPNSWLARRALTLGQQAS